MDCFDCSLEGTSTTAIGVCSHCGAALCAAHVTVCVKEVHHNNGPGPASTTGPEGRALCCSTCRDAGTGTTRLAG